MLKRFGLFVVVCILFFSVPACAGTTGGSAKNKNFGDGAAGGFSTISGGFGSSSVGGATSTSIFTTSIDGNKHKLILSLSPDSTPKGHVIAGVKVLAAKFLVASPTPLLRIHRLTLSNQGKDGAEIEISYFDLYKKIETSLGVFSGGQATFSGLDFYIDEVATLSVVITPKTAAGAVVGDEVRILLGGRIEAWDTDGNDVIFEFRDFIEGSVMTLHEICN